MAFIVGSPPCLAPLQELMLWDSVHSPHSGYHVEQVEIVFSPGCAPERISAAWAATVAATEALRTVFDFTAGVPTGLRTVADFPPMEFQNGAPDSWEAWREADRLRPLLFPGAVPWRIVWWPPARKLVWTFHHALLDGRSITRVLREFLTRLRGDHGNTLHRSKWQPPSEASLELAREHFRKWPVTSAQSAENPPSDGPMRNFLGAEVAMRLEARAAAMKTTAATLILWAWGQAVATHTGADFALVEQVRAGAPQPGTAGFTMGVLPLVIHRSGNKLLEDMILTLQADLLALRNMESVAFSDFAPGVYPDPELPGSSTIMIEHATLQHSLGLREAQSDGWQSPIVVAASRRSASEIEPLRRDAATTYANAIHQIESDRTPRVCDLVESVVLNERKADCLMATAYLRPDLRLEVDGPASQELLVAWADVLSGLGRG